MLNPYYESEDGANSESEPEYELANIPGHSPSELAAQIPSVCVENSSDIHIGPRLQYNGPVTLKQYITVNGKDGVKYLSHDIGNTGLQTPEIVIEDNVLNGSPRLTFPRNRYIFGVLMIVLLIAIIVALAVTLSGEEHSTSNLNKIQFFCENEDIDVHEGETIQWVVDVTASSEPKLVWYGSDCKELEERDGPSRFEVYTSPQGTVAKLKIHNISLQDRGLYRLHAQNKEDYQWAYFTLNVKSSRKKNVVVCYVAEWASRRQGRGKFTVDNIDAPHCSHLVYAFALLNITSNSIYSSSPKYDLDNKYGAGAYKKMTSLKEKHPHLKVLLGLGGWAERFGKNYSEVAESPSRRKALVQSVSDFLRKYNFDGLDLHWQYPAEQNGVSADKENFVYLLKDLREEFDKYNWLLTAPLGVIPDTIEHSFDVPAISKYLDYMFALCYAYHGHWESETGPNAPLYPHHPGDEYNVESSIRMLLQKGAPPEKLVLGLPLNGRIFTLRYKEWGVGFGEPATGAGLQGPYVQEVGLWGYNEICLELDKQPSNWVKRWDNKSHTPYASKDDQFISYDNAASLTDKVEWALKKKLAGVVVWSLDTDDFHGDCSFGKSGSNQYPLLQAINKALRTPAFLNRVPSMETPSNSGSVWAADLGHIRICITTILLWSQWIFVSK